MSKAIAFFPWWSIKEPLTIGPLRLLPYERGCAPGDLLDATQHDIDGVIAAYFNRPGCCVEQATILEFGEWRTGMDPVDPVLEDLFSAREAVAFAALAERKLFLPHCEYCNSDTFSLVVQRYQEGSADRFVYQTRKRDGGTKNYWTSDEFTFRRPLHVHEYRECHFDEKLIALLIDTRVANWLEAIAEFNRANTDLSDISPHVEMVMMKSAFERLLDISENKAEFSDAIEKRIKRLERAQEIDGPLKEQWEKRWPKPPRPILAWAREFCARRGAAAHGNDRSKGGFVWPESAHLAFASVLLPLMLKKIAADQGEFELTIRDQERLRRIDEYVLHDPFCSNEAGRIGYAIHPWVAIDKKTEDAELRVQALEALNAAYDCGTANAPATR